MRLLADENLSLDLVATLRHAGHDVLWVRECCPGIDDEEVLSRANETNRVLLTFDKGFGDMLVRHKMTASSGVILCRLKPPHSVVRATEIADIIAGRDDWQGHFAVITRERVRMAPLR